MFLCLGFWYLQFANLKSEIAIKLIKIGSTSQCTTKSDVILFYSVEKIKKMQLKKIKNALVTTHTRQLPDCLTGVASGGVNCVQSRGWDKRCEMHTS